MAKAIKITILSLLILILVGVMVSFISGGFKFKDMKGKLVYDESYALSEVNNINLDLRSHDVEILESEDENVKVQIYSKNKDSITLKKDSENNIVVNQKRENICVGLCFVSNMKVIVYLPEEYKGKINIKATSGDIKSTIENELAYNIKVTSGDVEIDNAKSLVGKTTSGDVQIGKLTSHIKYQTTSGDFEIEKFTVKKDSSIKATSGDVKIETLENAYVDADATSGDIKVKNNDRHAEFELKINTTSGDIDVN